MIDLEKVKTRIKSVMKECEDLIKIFENEIKDQNNPSFQEIKLIDNAIMNFKRSNLEIPNDLRTLKLKLVTNHERSNEILSLAKLFIDDLGSILAQDFVKLVKRAKMQGNRSNRSGNINESNYQRPLGAKGHSNLDDYLIPVISLMNESLSHTEAFKKIASELDVRFNTVSSQCTRGLNINTAQFTSLVKSGEIIDLLESKFPDRVDKIRKEAERGKWKKKKEP